MNLRERTLDHARKAADAADQVVEYQRRAKATIEHQRRAASRPSTGDTETDIDYAVNQFLKDHWPYRVLVDNRNGHQAATTAFGIAALVEALSLSPVLFPRPKDLYGDGQ